MDENLSERSRLGVDDEEENNPLKSISYKESWTDYLFSFLILFKLFLLTVLPMISLYLFLLYLTYNTLLKHEQFLSFSLYSYLHPLIALRVLYLVFLCPSVKEIYKSDYCINKSIHFCLFSFSISRTLCNNLSFCSSKVLTAIENQLAKAHHTIERRTKNIIISFLLISLK